MSSRNYKIEQGSYKSNLEERLEIRSTSILIRTKTKTAPSLFPVKLVRLSLDIYSKIWSNLQNLCYPPIMVLKSLNSHLPLSLSSKKTSKSNSTKMKSKSSISLDYNLMKNPKDALKSSYQNLLIFSRQTVSKRKSQI